MSKFYRIRILQCLKIISEQFEEQSGHMVIIYDQSLFVSIWSFFSLTGHYFLMTSFLFPCNTFL